MITTKILARAASLVVVGCMASGVAQANQINGTLGFAPFGGGVSFTGPNLGNATSVTFPSIEAVNTLPATFNGHPNDFTSFVALFSLVTVNPLTVNNPTAGALPGYVTFGGFNLDLASLTFSHSGNNALHIDGLGTMTGNSFDPTPAEFSASLTTTGRGAVNGSFTVSAPPTSVPDGGMTLTLLGTALTGLAFLRNRKSA